MDALAGLSFSAPNLLALLAAIPLVVWFLFARERTRRRAADAFASERIRGVRFPARAIRPFALSAGLALLAIAISGPRWGFELRPVIHQEGSLLLAIDVSASMSSQDLGVSRLAAAQAVAARILDGETRRVALIAFESIGELIAPLTSDTAAVSDLVGSLTAGEISIPGSDLGAAILTGVDYLKRSGSGPLEIILLSDGEDQGTLLEAALDAASESGIPVSTITLGTEKGATIPTERGGALRDESGIVVETVANPELMRRIADETGGAAVANPFEVQSLAAAIGRRLDPELRADSARTRRVPMERFQWPLAAGVLLLLGASFANRGAE